MGTGKKARSAEENENDPNPARIRNHKFESFTQRVARLKIDPIRRNRGKELEADEDGQTHFKLALNHWKELNLSESFSNFVQEVESFCDSLAQILHYKTKIVEALVKYLEKRNVLSLEPLLVLTSSLAHDLGTQFEEDFPVLLSLILDIAAKHKDIEVVEWSFSCLAWLFKYLSRLLVPDLRSTYDLVAKTLGRENHKPHIARFAAESISFLVRKAASTHQKNPVPLDKIVQHILSDLEAFETDQKHSEVYRYGIMSLFANTIKGVDDGFHTSGSTVYRTLLKHSNSDLAEDAVIGITTSLLHHGNAETFLPFATVLLEYVTQAPADTGSSIKCLNLVFTVCSVRHGTRVHDWRSIFDCISTFLQKHAVHLSSEDSHFQVDSIAAKIYAVAFARASLEVCTAVLRILNELPQRLSSQAYMLFCVTLARLNQDRFTKFILPTFMQQLVKNITNDQHHGLLAALTIAEQEVPLSLGSKSLEVFKSVISDLAASSSIDKTFLTAKTGYLDLLSLLKVDESAKRVIATILEISIQERLQAIGDENDQKMLFSRGAGLAYVLQHGQQRLSWNPSEDLSRHFGSLPLFLENVSLFIDSRSDASLLLPAGDAHDRILQALTSPDKHLRVAALKLLESLERNQGNSKSSSVLSIAQDLELLVLDAKNARTASMYVRRLLEQLHQQFEDEASIKIVTHFCFGLLHFKLSQIWTEAIEVLKELSNNATGDQIITKIVFEWLEVRPNEPSSVPVTRPEPKSKFDEFQCSAKERLSTELDADWVKLDTAEQQLQDRFDRQHELKPLINHECRNHALRVLKGLPELAERRSRHLIPIFLRLSKTQSEAGEETDHHDDVDTAQVLSEDKHAGILSRRDRLAVLDLMGSFTNPRMLYRSAEVYAELLRYLASGDAKTQGAALQALHTWKIPILDRYADNFRNLLDETRFREEIATFLTKDEISIDVDFAEVLPFLLRILYGRIISRIGSTTSKGSLGTKRRAVFDALARLGTPAIQEFTQIALGPLRSLEAKESQGMHSSTMSERQRLGLLNLLSDMINSLGEKVTPVLPSIVPAILYCGQQLDDSTDSNLSITQKDIRTSALQCLASISSHTAAYALSTYIQDILSIFVLPRLDNLAAETSQSVSAILQLISVWSSGPEMALWLATEGLGILDAVSQILTTPAVKDTVILFVVDQIFKPLARHAENGQSLDVKSRVLTPAIPHILLRIGQLLQSNPEKRVLASILSLLSALAESVEDASSIQTLLQLTSALLSQPSHRVSPRSKGDILSYLARFIPISGLSDGNHLLTQLSDALVPLLLYFKDRNNREQLCKVILELAKLQTELLDSAAICSDLDAFMTTSIDEPDLDRRHVGFTNIGAQKERFTAAQWKPIIYSLLYHIQDTEQTGIRTSASASLRTLVQTTASADDTSSSLFTLLEEILLPALRKGVTHKSELVREECLTVFAETVKGFPAWNRVNDLQPLLMNDDQEASFFNNILHVQQHRRLRALRRLAIEASKGQLRSANIAHFLIPLLEHFVLDNPEDKSEHNVVFETITTLSALTPGLEWPQFRAMFRRYTTYVLTNPDLEKPAIRLLTMTTEALTRIINSNGNSRDAMAVDDAAVGAIPIQYPLLTTLPKAEKFSEDVAKNLTAPLRQYVHHKDESLVSQRVPVAVTVAKLIMLLSEDQVVQQLPPLLTDVCQILRSRTQESRDLVRKTLVDICKTIGPRYFGFILKELRSALPRGYQLHVLSFTVHMLLVNVEATTENGGLDYCLPDIANVIMDDMFGATGQEKDAEDYISQMREIKSNKSYDSMEIVARMSSLGSINSLLQPIMALLQERLDLRMLKKIDELLRRLGIGLLRNPAVNSQAALVLCFELLQEVYSKESSSRDPRSQDSRRARFLINLNSVKKSNVTHSTTSAVHKLARFAFDLLRTILSRYDALQTPANVQGFMPVIGEAIMSSQEEVQISVFRLLSSIIRVPLVELDKNAPVYVSEAIQLIKNAASTSSEASQAALKLITVLVRDRDNVTVKETDVSYILQKIKTDLDEPDRQGITFNFLKAVLYRKLLVAEVYEIMDDVAAMMVRNQSASARNAARAVYVQFLVNYPQGKDRLKKQWAFLVKNLEYDFPEGRQSVMEAIHSLIGKVVDTTAQGWMGIFFTPLVLVTANDDSIECRKMASLLIKQFFERAEDDTLATMLTLLRTWLGQENQPLLFRVALQTFTLYVEANATKAKKDLPPLENKISEILQNAQIEDVVEEWETIYFTLQLLFRLVHAYPQELFSQSFGLLWSLVIQKSHYPHAWVKLASARLLGLYFADFARNNSDVETTTLPVQGSGGLELDFDTMMNVTRSSLNALRLPTIGEELAMQLVKNLVFLGRLLAAVARDDLERIQDSSDNGSDDDADETEESRAQDPLAFIFNRISSILRKEIISARAAAMVSKTATMRLLAALCSHLPASTLTTHSHQILLPLHILTDPSTSVPFSTDSGFKTAHAELIANAQELLGILQTKLGTTEFVAVMNKVRESVKHKRDERRVKRRIEAVANPEKAGEKRVKKRKQQREQRKGRNEAFRGQRRGW